MCNTVCFLLLPLSCSLVECRDHPYYSLYLQFSFFLACDDAHHFVASFLFYVHLQLNYYTVVQYFFGSVYFTGNSDCQTLKIVVVQLFFGYYNAILTVGEVSSYFLEISGEIEASYLF